MKASPAERPVLSDRLEAVLALLEPCELVVDIGTDHALVPLFAVQRGLARRAIGVDRRPAPLEAARPTIATHGAGLVILRLGDGLAAIAGEKVDAVVIAGVGGEKIIRILDVATEHLAGCRQLVLQPNQHADRVRAWARRAGWHLRAERMVLARGHFFQTLSLAAGGQADDPAYARPGFSAAELETIGPWLLREGGLAVRRYYQVQAKRQSALPDGLLRADVWQRALRMLE